MELESFVNVRKDDVVFHERFFCSANIHVESESERVLWSCSALEFKVNQ